MQPRVVDAVHGWSWIAGGYRLFAKSPAMWLALLAVLFICLNVLSLIPFVGVVLLLLLVPVLLAGLMEGCRAVENGEPLKVAHLACGFIRNGGPLVTLGGVSLIGTILVAVIMRAIAGNEMDRVLQFLAENPKITGTIPDDLRGPFAVVGRAAVVGMLVYLPIVMAQWYAPLLVYFHNLSALAAMKLSLVACTKNALPLLTYSLVLFVAMAIVMPFAKGFAFWLLAPVVLPSLYASYKDIYLASAVETPADASA